MEIDESRVDGEPLGMDDEVFASAAEAVRRDPGDAVAWDQLEERATTHQAPEPVAALYREVLTGELSPETLAELGPRAVRFHEEWLGGDAAPLVAVLGRVLDADPSADWAFQALSVVHTVAERWEELLALYEQQIARTADADRRAALLEEAAQTAKDFAGAPDRAIAFLEALLPLRPDDAALVASLERLLERQGRRADLIGLWRSRLPRLEASAARTLELRMARALVDEGEAADALAVLRAHDGTGAGAEEALALVEGIGRDEAVEASVRREALGLVRSRYAAANRTSGFLGTVDAALPLADEEERIVLHLEAAESLLAAPGHRGAEALEHLGDALLLTPQDVELATRVASLADEADAAARGTELLLAAAERSEPAVAAPLRLKAAGRLLAAGQADAALAEFMRVRDGEHVPPDLARAAGRRLADAVRERPEERLAALVRLAAMAPEGDARAAVRGEAAEIAEGLGRVDDAVALLGQRLADDPEDEEARAARIALLERHERADALAEALSERAARQPSPLLRRADRVRVARLQEAALGDAEAALASWEGIARDHGEDVEVTDALARLYAVREQPEDMAALLERAARREEAHLATVRVQQGEAYVTLGRLGDALAAYTRALDADPAHEGARGGAAALADHAEVRPEALEALCRAFLAAGEWDPLLALVDQRIQVAPNRETRVRMLEEAASLQEAQAHAPVAAMHTLRRAFALDPTSLRVERELRRLAEATGEWGLCADAFRDAAQASDQDDRREASLRADEAAIREEELGDRPKGLEAAAAALLKRPRRVDLAERVARLGLATEGWALAEGALRAAAAAPEAPVELLTCLAQVQRAAGSRRGLAATLERLADQMPRNLDPLVELAELVAPELPAPAGEVTTVGEVLDDPALARRALTRLYERAASMWRLGTEATGTRRPAAQVGAALDRLLELLDAAAAEGDEAAAREAVARLEHAAQLDWPPKLRAARGRDAGARYLALGDDRAAAACFQRVLAERPDDAVALDALAGVLAKAGRHAELLGLRHRQLGLATELDERLRLRLEIVDLVTRLEAETGRVEALRANLREQPGHGESVRALEALLIEERRHEELASLLAEEARAVEGEAAGELWSRIARLAETQLDDPARAIDAHRRVVEVRPDDAPALDALARLQKAAGDEAAAARWLERRLVVAAPEERAALALRLADALLAAERPERAKEVLEAAREHDPTRVDVRDRLLDLYRRLEAHAPLARLLGEAANGAAEPDLALAFVREAAALHREALDDRAGAIPVLRRGLELAPGEQELSLQLAEGLAAREAYGEARAVLEGLIEGFGRRRSAERAEVHYRLGLIRRAEGDVEAALRELEEATSMARTEPRMRERFARLAREAGQLDRAEKAYRALLMAVRRRPDDGARLDVGTGEVLYELHTIARARGEAEPAEELLASALEAAAHSDAEALRFKDALLERDDAEVARQGLERRAQVAPTPESRARVLGALADVLVGGLGLADEAFARRREALEAAPGDRGLQEAFLASARMTGQLDVFEATVRGLAEARADAGDAEAQATLLVCLGEVAEERGDASAAVEFYAQAEAGAERPLAAWQGLARIGAARDDRALQRRVLALLAEAPELGEASRASALYQLAEVALVEPETAAEGAVFGRRAFDLDPQPSRLAEVLDAALTRAPEPAVLALFEEVARGAGDDAVLFRFLRRRAEGPGATPDHIREAADKARQLDEPELAEALAARAIDLAEASEEGPGAARWALQALATARRAAGDVAGALAWLERLAAATDDPRERRGLQLQRAELASEGGDLRAAIAIYEGLHGQDPTDRSAWEPLLGAYVAQGDLDRGAGLVSGLVDVLLDADDRNAARLILGRALFPAEGRGDEAATLLQGVLDEEPGHPEATSLLAAHYESSGDEEALVALLEQQLDLARGDENDERTRAITLRLAHRLAPSSPDEAKDVLRRGLDWLPGDAALAEALLALLGEDAEPRERAEVHELLVAGAEGEVAAARAREAYAAWERLDDVDGMGRALRLGYAAMPEDEALRAGLERWHRTHDDAPGLAAFLLQEGRRLLAAGEEDAGVARVREAATLRRDALGDAEGAAAMLREVRAKVPHVALLRELVSTLEQAGDAAGAAEEVGAALEALDGDENADAETRTALLGVRARLGLGLGRTDDAVRDLEAAYATAPAAVAEDLVTALRHQQAEARDRQDPSAERAALLRLVDVLGEQHQAEAARECLDAWVMAHPDDVEVLLKLRSADVLAENWEGVADTSERLTAVLEGPPQVEAALLLADACEAMDAPERARAGLERVVIAQPGAVAVTARLRPIYERSGAHRELAHLVQQQAAVAAPELAFELFREAAHIWSERVGEVEEALPALRGAHALQPEDHDTTLRLADGYIASGYFAEAGQVLEQVIGRHSRRRSPELSELQHRMARLARAAGDARLEMQWLTAALESDKNNGLVSSELAVLAYDLQELDVALMALRAVTLSKEEGPMSRAEAFLMQARIAHTRGEARRALLWARKARSEDPKLLEAEVFLKELGE